MWSVRSQVVQEVRLTGCVLTLKKKNKVKTALVGFERKETYRERQHDPDHSSLYIMSILPPTTCILAAFSLLYRWDK